MYIPRIADPVPSGQVLGNLSYPWSDQETIVSPILLIFGFNGRLICIDAFGHDALYERHPAGRN